MSCSLRRRWWPASGPRRHSRSLRVRLRLSTAGQPSQGCGPTRSSFRARGRTRGPGWGWPSRRPNSEATAPQAVATDRRGTTGIATGRRKWCTGRLDSRAKLGAWAAAAWPNWWRGRGSDTPPSLSAPSCTGTMTALTTTREGVGTGTASLSSSLWQTGQPPTVVLTGTGSDGSNGNGPKKKQTTCFNYSRGGPEGTIHFGTRWSRDGRNSLKM